MKVYIKLHSNEQYTFKTKVVQPVNRQIKKTPFFFRRNKNFQHITDMFAFRWLKENKITRDQKLSVCVVIYTARKFWWIMSRYLIKVQSVGIKVSKIRNLYLRTDFSYLRIHTSSIRKNTLRDVPLIKLSFLRFVSTGCFLIILKFIRSKHMANRGSSAIIFNKILFH
jgi:hypothetical protein